MSTTWTPEVTRKILDEHPAFAGKLYQFMALRDAADVLEALQPPYYQTAAAYLEEVADTVLRGTGIGEDFVQAMIAARPPFEGRGQ
jgi:hypothetical protein